MVRITLRLLCAQERERNVFYLTTHSTHFIYGYMASDIWLRTILIVRKETRCRHIDYSFRLTARVLLYAPSHRQDNTYHGLCYTSRGALARMRNTECSKSELRSYPTWDFQKTLTGLEPLARHLPNLKLNAMPFIAPPPPPTPHNPTSHISHQFILDQKYVLEKYEVDKNQH